LANGLCREPTAESRRPKAKAGGIRCNAALVAPMQQILNEQTRFTERGGMHPHNSHASVEATP
jgi:hypothetical protein